MIRPLAACAALAVVLGFNAIAPAIAAPPTVVPSPGYDRRLVESRKALGSSYYDEGRVVVAPRAYRGHVRRHRSSR